MADNEEILARLRVQNAAGFKRDIDSAAGSVTRLGDTTKATAEKTKLARAETFAWTTGIRLLRQHIYLGVYALEAFGGELIHLGFQYDEAQAKGVAAFTGILGSARAATVEMAALNRVGEQTGIALGTLSASAATMTEFGFSVRQTNESLAAFSKFVQIKDLGAGGLQTLVGIFDRIQQQGQLTGRTMLTLMREGVPVMSILREQLHLTDQQIRAIQKGKLAVPAALAIPALTAGIGATPGIPGLSGSLDRVKFGLSELVGIGEKSGFDTADRFLSGFADRIDAGIVSLRAGHGFLIGFDPSGRLLADWRALEAGIGGVAAGLGLFVLAARDAVKAAAWLGFDVLTKHTTLLKYAVAALTFAYVTSRTAMLAAFAAGKLVAAGEALLTIATDAYLVSLYALDGELVVTGTAFAALDAAMGLATGPVGWLALAAVGFYELYVHVGAFHRAVDDTYHWIVGHWPLLAGIIAFPFLGPLALVAGVLYEFRGKLLALWRWLESHVFTLNFSFSVGGGNHLHGLLANALNIGLRGITGGAFAGLAGGGTVTRGGSVLVGERGPEILNLPRAATVTPMRFAGDAAARLLNITLVPVSTELTMDGRKVGQGVFKYRAEIEARQ